MRLLSALVLSLLSAVAIAADQPTELQVKAAYVLNFAKFTEWPDRAFRDARASMLVCVLGNADVLAAFAGIEGKMVQGREVRISSNPRGAELQACQVLYLSQSNSADPGSVLKSAAGRPILTVSDTREFAERGGMLGLIPVDGRIRFEANAEAARAAGLRLSAQLLSLAQAVR